MERTQKEQVVADFHADFSAAQGAVLVDYQGLTDSAVKEIRKAFRAEGVKYRVVKNSLAKIATQGTPLSVLENDFVGPTAIAYSLEDPVAPARVASEYAEKEKKFEIRCGYCDSARLDVAGVDALAKLPGKNELRSKLLNLFNAPATNLVRTMNAVPQQIVLVMAALKDKLGEGGEGEG